MEPLYKGHAGIMKIVFYREVSFIQRLNKSISIRSKQVSFIERRPLFGGSFIRGSIVFTHECLTLSCLSLKLRRLLTPTIPTALQWQLYLVVCVGVPAIGWSAVGPTFLWHLLHARSPVDSDTPSHLHRG